MLAFLMVFGLSRAAGPRIPHILISIRSHPCIYSFPFRRIFIGKSMAGTMRL
jgi:hypothetical protein